MCTLLLLPDIARAQKLVTGTGAGMSPSVRVIDSGGTDTTFQPYDPAFLGGVRVALGDVTGDGVLDIVTAAGPGGGPHVRVWDGTDLTEVGGFFAYSPAFSGGVFVAAGDVTGDGRADIITGAGAGGGPHVRVWDGATFAEVGGFFAYDPAFPGGVRVAAGDVTGDGIADIVTAPGPGGGPHVRVWNGATFAEVGGFFAYDPAFAGGVFVAAGDITGDGKAEIVTGVGPGGGPHVRVWNGADLTEVGGFFAYDPSFGGGVVVGLSDLDRDGRNEIVTAPQTGLPLVRLWTGTTFALFGEYLAFDPAGGRSGVFIGSVAENPSTDDAPRVESTVPANNATDVPVDADLTVTFSEAVTAGVGAFVLECAAGTPIFLTNSGLPATTFTLNPPPLPLSTACTLRIVRSQIADDDTDDPPDTMTADVTVSFTTSACTLITVGPTTVPFGTVNLPYTPVTFFPTGGTPPFTWTITSGTLPAGMNFSASGVLSGTPTQAGAFPLTITATASGGCTGSVSLTLNIASGSNQPPSFTVGANQTVLEDAGAQTVANWATAISPGPTPDEAGQVVTFNITGNTNPALFGTAPAVSPTGTLTYTPAANANGTATFTLVLQDTGGTANGGVNTSAPATFTITITPVNDPPALTTPVIAYATAGNTQLHVAGATIAGLASIADAASILSKSVPVDADGPVLPTVAAFSGTTPNGTVAINADGSFTYVPNAGFAGTDTFPFQVTDSAASVAGTISISVSNLVWYVNNQTDTNNPVGGNGRSTDAFETLAAAASASAANDIIFVFNGQSATTPLTDGITLKNGQKLHGEGVGLTVGSFGTIVVAGTQPRIQSAGNTVAVLANTANGDRIGVEIRGLDLQSSTANAIHVTSANGQNLGVRISENTISGSGGTLEGIDINQGSTGTATLAVHDNSITAAGTGLDITRTLGAVIITTFDDNTVSGNTLGSGIVVNGPVTFDATPGGTLNAVNGGTTRVGVSGNGVSGAGMVLTSVTGSLVFADLDLFADNGAGLSVTGTGAITSVTGTRITAVPNAATFVSANGPAVLLMDLTADLQAGGLTSTNSVGDGVLLSGVVGTFTAPSTASITDAGGVDFNIVGGTADVTYNGTITDDVGTLVHVAGTNGGTKSFTGAVTDGNDGDGDGITLTGNGGATITFSGGILLSTGANAAFTATGGGMINVCDENPCSPAAGTLVNSLQTTTGTALNVSGTTIGASGLIFRSISANGAVNGIVLNNVGSGGLSVTGDGGGSSNGSGGVIQNTTGPGIILTSTGPISLGYMNVQNSGDDGIRAATVSGFTLTRSNITNNGNAVDERGIELFQLSGSGGITNSTITGSGETNVRIENDTANLTAFNVTGTTIATTNFTTGDDGFLVLNTGSASMTVSVTGSTFTDNKGDHFQAATDADATGPMNITFSNNTLTTTAANDPLVIGGGITISPSGSTDLTFAIDGNNIQQAFDEGINLNLGTASTAAASMIGTISNNIVGSPGAVDSGSESGTGISVTSNGAGTTTVSVTNNQVFQYANPYGILLNHKEGSSTMNATVTGNTVANPGTSAVNGVRVDSGATANDTGTMCVALTGNTVAGSGPGVDRDIRLRQRFGTTIRLPGYGGANNDSTAVDNFVAGNNLGADVSSALNVGLGGGFVGGAACAVPQ